MVPGISVKEIFRLAEHRSIKITDLLVLVFYADRIAILFRISVAMSFLRAFFLASYIIFITINTISTENVEFDSDGSIPRS